MWNLNQDVKIIRFLTSTVQSTSSLQSVDSVRYISCVSLIEVMCVIIRACMCWFRMCKMSMRVDLINLQNILFGFVRRIIRRFLWQVCLRVMYNFWIQIEFKFNWYFPFHKAYFFYPLRLFLHFLSLSFIKLFQLEEIQEF